MKKKLIFTGWSLGAVLLLGALAVETVEQLFIEPRTVESVGDIFERYLEERETLPPLPLPKSPAELISSMEFKDYSFLNTHWYMNHASILYVAEGSVLAHTISLPLEILAIEDITRGEITIFYYATNGQWEGLALYDAPALLDETDPDYQSLTDEEKEQELLLRFNSARICWTAVLKPEEDAWNDVLAPGCSASSLSVASETMMRSISGPPPEHTNDLWMAIDRTNVYVYAPVNFSNHVEIYSTDNLVSNVWNIATQNLTPSGTNPEAWTFSATEPCGFFRAGDMDTDTDGDGVPDAREICVYKTDPDVSNLSPAIGNGADLGSVDAVDIDNNRRVGAWTIGAYQVNVSTSSVDTIAPVVYLVEPFEGTVVSHGTLTVSAAAKDDVVVAGVQFRVNGSNVGTEVTTPPFSNVWNAAAATNGAYELTAVARDATGNTDTSAVVSVIVNTNATDYYVSSVNTNASDSYPGTDPDYPWETIGKIKSSWTNFNAGDTIHLERGSSWDVNTSSGDWIDITHGGSALGSITIRGDDYGTGSKPVISSTVGAGHAFFLVEASYVIFRDFELNGGNHDTSGFAVGSYSGDISHINILNMNIHDCGGSSGYVCGIWYGSQATNAPYAVTDSLIQGNTVSGYSAHGLNCYSPGTMNNLIWRNNVVSNSYSGGRFLSANSGIQIGGKIGSGCIFENNFIQDTTTTEGAVLIFGKYEDMTGTAIVRHNIITGSPVYGVLVTMDEQGFNDTVHFQLSGNLIYANGRAGIGIASDNYYGSNSTIEIYNNTLFNNCQSGVHFPSDNNKMGEISIHHSFTNTTIQMINNLIYHVPHDDSICLNYSIYETPGGTFIHNNNLYYDSIGASARLVEALTGTYELTNITSFESTAQAGNPLLINTNQLPTETTLDGGTNPDGLAVQAWP